MNNKLERTAVYSMPILEATKQQIEYKKRSGFSVVASSQIACHQKRICQSGVWFAGMQMKRCGGNNIIWKQPQQHQLLKKAFNILFLLLQNNLYANYWTAFWLRSAYLCAQGIYTTHVGSDGLCLGAQWWSVQRTTPLWKTGRREINSGEGVRGLRSFMLIY